MPSSVSLSAANGRHISVAGEFSTTISIYRLKRQFTWYFVVADAKIPILGAEFLSNQNLLIDCANNAIVDRTTTVKSSLKQHNDNFGGGTISVKITQTQNSDLQIQKLINKYSNVFLPLQAVDITPFEHDVHVMDTEESKPTFCKVR